jgi:hypothetical protein
MADPEKRPPRWADAWQQLVYEHSPFRAVDDEDFQPLLAQLGELERLFLTTEGLRAYYAEWEPTSTAATPEAAVGRVGRSPADRTIHVAAIQLQLMEDAFYSLRLDRYANAPDNRGWMNLFRRWTRSPTFRAHVQQLAPTFSKQFIWFYEHYIENWELDLPVPHPWDLKSGRASYAQATMDALKACRVRRGKGIFLDPGRVEVGARGAYKGGEPVPLKEGQHGTKGSSAKQAQPSGAAEDSSKTTD